MERLIEQEFYKWKHQGCKKPILLVGARQIGKTFSVLKFCKENYKNVVYINLEKERDIVEIFQKTLDPEKIIFQIEILFKVDLHQDGSILILDEIQICEQAITSLKYFCEDKNGFPVIGAGSLLGVKLHRFQSSFPVGKVDILYMYPMNFHEYLIAQGENKLIQMIQEHYQTMEALPNVLHEKALELYKEYLYTGGMPEIVQDRISTPIMELNTSLLELILAAYMADMHKYTNNTESIKNIQIYQSIPSQLAKENKKFKYSIVDKSARSKYYQTSMDWLLASKMLLKSTLVSTPKIPLRAYEEQDMFKIYMSDTGLLTSMSGLTLYDILNENNEMFMGALTENYIANEFVSFGLPLNYYTFSNYEIDFILAIRGNIIPIECKAGKRTISKSLKNYIEKYMPSYAIRFSTKNFGFENQIKSIPLYAVFTFCEEWKESR